MTDKPNQNLVVVGQIAGAFGVKGEVRVRSYTADPVDCFSYGPLLDENGEVVLTPIKHRPMKDLFGVVAKEPLEREGWEALKGANLHVPRDAMPDDTDEDEYYVVDLIDCKVIHADGRELGTVRDIANFGAGDLLEITEPSVGKYFLPFDNASSVNVDIVAKKITIAPEEVFLPERLHRQSDDDGTN